PSYVAALSRPRTPSFSFSRAGLPPPLHSFPTRRSSDLRPRWRTGRCALGRHERPRRGSHDERCRSSSSPRRFAESPSGCRGGGRSEEHTSELQSRGHLVCRLLLEKKKKKKTKKQT